VPVSPARNRVEVMHGVNLDMLGRRDPAHYGRLTLSELEEQVVGFARELELEVHCFRTPSASSWSTCTG
jgi:3-dehydroquinate dehydratase-2